VDERSDVFALGAMLSFLLTGAAPVRARPDEQHAPGRVWPRQVPRALAAVCEKAMSLDPVGRYAGASELAVEIGRFRAGQRVGAHHEGLVERFRRLGWKYSTPILLVIAYLLMRLLLAIFNRA
jgi:eukaryotic-like serine/threonine-protein kinase